MKRMICLLTALLLFLCGCSLNNSTFTKDEDGNLISPEGVAYSHLANEGVLYYFGELELVGNVQGEMKTSQHLGLMFQTGMFAIKNDEDRDVLIRRKPNSEWCSIYRKASLPALDYSVDNCVRLEFVPGIGDVEKDAEHTSCGEGMTIPSEIAAFLSEVRSQKSPDDAGLYDLVRKPDGGYENCYVCGVIYGFFAEEPNVAIRMTVTSYNDLAYSVSIEEKDYVLPEALLLKLQNK
jgi:hypothetical protein